MWHRSGSPSFLHYHICFTFRDRNKDWIRPHITETFLETIVQLLSWYKNINFFEHKLNHVKNQCFFNSWCMGFLGSWLSVKNLFANMPYFWDFKIAIFIRMCILWAWFHSLVTILFHIIFLQKEIKHRRHYKQKQIWIKLYKLQISNKLAWNLSTSLCHNSLVSG